MTELELRQKVAKIIASWEGATKGSAAHYEILNIYNGHTPLSRSYAVKPTDAWCAATASAAYIAADMAEWSGTECSCSAWMAIARQKGVWIEDDAHAPKVGDAVLYDWQDDGKGENTGAPDHIGIVIGVGDGGFTVMEGNMGTPSRVGRRSMKINGRYIRGFLCPDFAAAAKELTAREDAAKAKEAAEKASGSPVGERKTAEGNFPGYLNSVAEISEFAPWATETVEKLISKGVLKGSGKLRDVQGRPADLALSADMLRLLALHDRMGLYRA